MFEKFEATNWMASMRIRLTALLFFAASTCLSSASSTEGVSPGKPIIQIDSRYGPISGSPSGYSYFFHYCLPDFKPLLSGDCSSESNKKEKVQVGYKYYLGRSESPRLEAALYFKLPFLFAANYEGNTPYYLSYSKALASASRRVYRNNSLVGAAKYPGLASYIDSLGRPVLWIPEKYTADLTRLGNPLVFVCARTFCALTLDMGNGWVAEARFDESALQDWNSFYKNLYRSADVIFDR
jgi:hypothetical protein